MHASRVTAAFLILLAGAAAELRAQVPSITDFPRWLAILDAEDRRATDAEFANLGRATDVLTPDLQRALVRAMGRVERPSLIGQISAFLSSSSPEVRGQAARALAQAVNGENPPPSAIDSVHHLLLDALKLDGDKPTPSRAAIVQSLGRVRYVNPSQVFQAERALLDALKDGQRDAASESSGLLLREACIAFESLIRLNRRLQPPSPDTIGALQTIATSHTRYGRARAPAMAALVASAAIDADLIDRTLTDPTEIEVRRLAAGALRALAAERPDLLDRALRDQSPAVRLEGVRAYGANPFDGCGRLVDATTDPNDHVVHTAIDLLAGPCTSENVDIGEVLNGFTQNVGQIRSWQRGGHAIVALAVRDRRRATEALPIFSRHLSAGARVYGARAAAILKLAPVLTSLADDRDDNVRQAALVGLHPLVRHDADEIYLDQLKRRDYQLLISAAAALLGTPLKERTAAAAFEALARVTAEKRETSRNARLALLQLLREAGEPRSAADLKPYLSDFDVQIASEASLLYEAWTETRLEIDPKPLPRANLPTLADVVYARSMIARIRLRWAGDVCLAFRLDDAPLTTLRFVRLVRERYFNGLTFHRVVPNFIAQGGSPSANDYAPADRFWRDEPGLPHVTGAVGISSHGRDSGDAQFFIDLADNYWLSHQFTVFATASGEAVGRILEGDQIVMIEMVPANTVCR